MPVTTFDWLGSDWLKLKKQIILLCTRHTDRLFDQNDLFQDDLFPAFRDAVLNDIQSRISRSGTGLWQEAMGLLARLDDLQPVLKKEMSRPKPDASPAQTLGQCLRYFLEDARRELVSLETGEGTGKIKTWERIDRISRKIMAAAWSEEEGGKERSRCRPEHFRQVHAYIKTHHNKDYNYPQKLSSIEDYFYLFCDCCRESVEPETLREDPYSMTTAKAYQLLDLLCDDGVMEGLEKCLRQLSLQEAEVLNVEFRLGLGKTGYLSAATYRREKEVSKRAYDTIMRQALRKLANCLLLSHPQAIRGAVK